MTLSEEIQAETKRYQEQTIGQGIKGSIKAMVNGTQAAAETGLVLATTVKVATPKLIQQTLTAFE